jgi:hypothetical protein
MGSRFPPFAKLRKGRGKSLGDIHEKAGRSQAYVTSDRDFRVRAILRRKATYSHFACELLNAKRLAKSWP